MIKDLILNIGVSMIYECQRLSEILNLDFSNKVLNSNFVNK